MTMLDHAAAPAGPAAHNGAPHAGMSAPAGPVPHAGPAVATDAQDREVVGGSVDARVKSRARARAWYWTWLLFATVVSVGGNVIHAWMAAPAPHLKVLASVAAATTPLLLLGAMHSVALLIKNRRSGYRRVDAYVFAGALAITVGVGALTFVTSYFSLRALILVLGFDVGQARLWPIPVDLSLVCSTLALLTSTSADSGGLDEELTPQMGGAAPAAIAASSGPSSPAERQLWWESIGAVVQQRHPDVRKIAELSTVTVAEILRRLYDVGDSQRAVCGALDLHHRDVKTIKQTADEVLARVVPATELAA